jgi:hypothetical protein
MAWLRLKAILFGTITMAKNVTQFETRSSISNYHLGDVPNIYLRLRFELVPDLSNTITLLWKLPAFNHFPALI